uniref:Uncharacterized protein n=1 Tax=Nephromyces sp. ex Molgula occidentalis TaxID=2544991 RepID=A0A5C1H858_9APIC|nr:hypothetical protein [Nephromyces sp. ex Molgula occidentalis]
MNKHINFNFKSITKKCLLNYNSSCLIYLLLLNYLNIKYKLHLNFKDLII